MNISTFFLIATVSFFTFLTFFMTLAYIQNIGLRIDLIALSISMLLFELLLAYAIVRLIVSEDTPRVRSI